MWIHLCPTHDISVVNADGTNHRRITYNRVFFDTYLWSPDSKRIVFPSCNYASNSLDICIVEVGSGKLTRLMTSNTENGSRFAWSPNSKNLAFEVDTGNRIDIYTANSDGGNVRRLTDNNQFNVYPAWSPDSQKIAFWSTLSYEGGPPKIYLMNADGSEQIIFDDGFNPVWSPR
jgi:Tol biopolymer transport system component